MEEKKKIGISTILLIIAIIALAVMGAFIYKLNNDKKLEVQKNIELQGKVADLNNTINELQGKIDTISETIKNETLNDSSSSSSVKTTDNDSEKIILNGTYAIPDSEIGWDFKKDGSVVCSGNTADMQGTYKTTGKGTIEAHYTKSDVLDDETNERSVVDIDVYEHFTIDDNGDVFWTNPDGKKVQLKVYGEVDKRN